jgi:hypothetical protein
MPQHYQVTASANRSRDAYVLKDRYSTPVRYHDPG